MRLIQQLINKENDKIYTNNRKFTPNHELEIMTISLAKSLLQTNKFKTKENNIIRHYKKRDTAKLINEINNNKDLILHALKLKIILTRKDKDVMKTNIIGGKYVWMVYDYG